MKPAIAQSVLSRANGHCEACGGQFGLFEWTPEIDHFFSRARADETEETLWVLHRACHRDKTDGKPSAGEWLKLFLEHCARHGYRSSYERAFKRLGIVEAREKFAKASLGEGA